MGTAAGAWRRAALPRAVACTVTAARSSKRRCWRTASPRAVACKTDAACSRCTSGATKRALSPPVQRSPPASLRCPGESGSGRCASFRLDIRLTAVAASGLPPPALLRQPVLLRQPPLLPWPLLPPPLLLPPRPPRPAVGQRRGGRGGHELQQTATAAEACASAAASASAAAAACAAAALA